jgi:GNAT superfamily N-acetyltransferase
VQVNAPFQNKGIGAHALAESLRLAKQSNAKKLSLKVFKISPAQRLYKREGFILVSEDERFYYMEKEIT